MNIADLEKAKAVFFGLLAAIAGLLFLRLKWTAGPDFDLTGFFWLIQNAGRLSLLLVFLACAAAAIVSGIRAFLEE